MRNWIGRLRDQAGGSSPPTRDLEPRGSPGVWRYFAEHQDPLGALIDYKRTSFRHHLYTGLNLPDGQALWTEEADSSLLVVGSAGTNKTVAILIINVLLAVGACLTISARDDIYRATARARRRLGRVWIMSARPVKVPDGVIELCFSPLQGCEIYSYAAKVAHRFASWIDRSEYALLAGARGHPHFRDQCADLLTGLFHLAAVLGYDMGWIHRVIKAKSLSRTLGDLENVLRETYGEDEERWPPSIRAAWDAIEFIRVPGHEERGSILTTCANALRAYGDPDVVEKSKNPNFDFKAFVRGLPDADLDMLAKGVLGIQQWMRGSYDTVYIVNTSAEDPAVYVYLEFEARIREAMYEYWSECENRDDGQQFMPLPLTVANDEGAVAPPYALGDLLAQNRNRGVLFIMAIQTMSQARNIFGQLGADFFSQFRHTVMFPPILDRETAELLIKLGGTYWHEQVSQTFSPNSGPGMTYASIERDRFDFRLLAQGRPGEPDAAICLDEHGDLFWSLPVPYYEGPLWPRLLISSCYWSVHHGVEPGLPIPPLARGGDYRYLDEQGLEEHFRAVTEMIRSQRNERELPSSGTVPD